MPFLRRHVYKAYALTKEIAYINHILVTNGSEQVAVLLRRRDL